jgi:cytoskeletal protein RodZ
MASFGENLRRERELRGVSLREIAEGTKISVRFLQALEDDRIDVLPGGLFPKAFVRQYASFLGLDPDRAAADFVLAQGAPEPEARPRTPAGWRLPVSPGSLFLAAIAVTAVALAFRRPVGESERRAQARATPAPVAAAPAVLPGDRVYPPPPAEPAAAASPSSEGLVLTLTAQQSCWVQVRADGETVLNRVLAEGESQTLEARGEIVLSVGNAGGLRVRVNDRPTVPLGRSGEVRKNIVITRQNLPSLVERDGAAAPDGHSG